MVFVILQVSCHIFARKLYITTSNAAADYSEEAFVLNVMIEVLPFNGLLSTILGAWNWEAFTFGPVNGSHVHQAYRCVFVTILTVIGSQRACVFMLV